MLDNYVKIEPVSLEKISSTLIIADEAILHIVKNRYTSKELMPIKSTLVWIFIAK